MRFGNLPPRIVVLSAEGSGESAALEQTFRQLGRFWTFEVEVVPAAGISAATFADENGPTCCLVVLAAIASGGVEDAALLPWDIVESLNGSVPLLAMHRSAEIQSAVMPALWGVKGIREIRSPSTIGARIRQGDDYTAGLGIATEVATAGRYYHGSLEVADALPLIFSEEHVLVARKGLNVYVGAHVRQLGIVSLKPFFGLVRNILLAATGRPFLCIGPYASLRVDDFPAVSAEFFRVLREPKRVAVRLLAGYAVGAPWLLALELVTIVVLAGMGLARQISFGALALGCGALALLVAAHLVRGRGLYGEFPGLSLAQRLFFTGYDVARARLLRKMMRAHSRHGVLMDHMITTHALLPDGARVRQDGLFPRTTRLLRELYSRGEVNINAHGVTHINRARLEADGTVDSREYLGLGETETRELMTTNLTVISEIFGRRASGLTAPAWGYERGVTKKVASGFFDFIVERNSVFLEDREVQPFGQRDPRYGFLHAPETWEYGMEGENEAEPPVWEAYACAGLPIHFLMHGPTCPTQPEGLTPIARAGEAAGVRWIFLEDLVRLAEQFAAIRITTPGSGDAAEVRLRCDMAIDRPIMLVSASRLESVVLDGSPIDASGRTTVWLPPLEPGEHRIRLGHRETELP